MQLRLLSLVSKNVCKSLRKQYPNGKTDKKQEQIFNTYPSIKILLANKYGIKCLLALLNKEISVETTIKQCFRTKSE